LRALCAHTSLQSGMKGPTRWRTAVQAIRRYQRSAAQTAPNQGNRSIGKEWRAQRARRGRIGGIVVHTTLVERGTAFGVPQHEVEGTSHPIHSTRACRQSFPHQGLAPLGIRRGRSPVHRADSSAVGRTGQILLGLAAADDLRLGNDDRNRDHG